MNAEDCLLHRPYIDVPGPEGIYYPWICSCPYPEHDCDWVPDGSGWGAECDICGEIVDLR